MKPREEENYSTKYLSIRFLFALSLIAALIVSAYAALIVYSYSQSSFAAVINLSGRQRMISQKLVKESLLLANSQTPDERELNRILLSDTLCKWNRIHVGLQRGDDGLELSGENSELIYDLFDSLNPVYKKLLFAVSEIMETTEDKETSTSLPYNSLVTPHIREILDTSSLFLEGMDRVVNQYEIEAREKERGYILIFSVIIAAVLFLLVIEAIFIFQPLVAKVRMSNQAYQQTNDQLKLEIIEIERTKASLRESEKKYRDLVETSQDLIWRINQDGRFIFLNSAWEKTLGYSLEEMEGEQFIKFKPPEEAELALLAYKKVLQGGSVTSYETSYISKTGKEIILNFKAKPLLDSSGQIVGTQGTATDITELKEAEEQRSKYEQELVEANKELSQYAHVVAHDLKTPLRGIHSYADFLREDLEGQLKDEQKKYLEGLIQATREADDLVNDLLELSKVGQNQNIFEAIDLNSFFTNLIGSIKMGDNVEVVMGDDWPTIEVEPILLKQIFQNLFSNSVKFNSSSSKRIELFWRKSGNKQYEFSVKDNGIGIEKRYQENIFKIFERLHPKDEYDGTGVGLAIVSKAVGKLGGSVRIESKPGEGSTFFVTLPEKKMVPT